MTSVGHIYPHGWYSCSSCRQYQVCAKHDSPKTACTEEKPGGGASKPAGARKLSGAEYGNGKGQATVTFRRSLSQTEFTKDFDSGITGLQRPSKPVQLPVQLPAAAACRQGSVDSRRSEEMAEN